jgi:hypothetical protein
MSKAYNFRIKSETVKWPWSIAVMFITGETWTT